MIKTSDPYKNGVLTSLNPLKITDDLHIEYLDFLKSSFVQNNEELSRRLDSLAEGNRLWKLPYISINQNYQSGLTGKEIASKFSVNSDVLSATGIPRFYKHQESGIKNILSGRNTVISSGTGSGKTETFLVPILNECTKYDNAKGIKAVIVYPMNALANDQVERIRGILYELNKKRKIQNKKEITIGIYTGQTPRSITDQTGKRSEDFDALTTINTKCPSCKKYSLHVDTDGGRSYYSCNAEKDFRIEFQLVTRKEIQDNPPDILITNYVILEYLLLRKSDKVLFENNKIQFVVLDEIHTYAGARGVDVALLIRRLKRRILSGSTLSGNITSIGTSATISREKEEIHRQEKIAEFASKLFGSKFNPGDVFEGKREEWEFPQHKKIIKIESIPIPENLEIMDDSDFIEICKIISPDFHGNMPITLKDKERVIGRLLIENEFFQFLIKTLSEPRSIEELIKSVASHEIFSKIISSSDLSEENISRIIWSYLRMASLASDPRTDLDFPLVRLTVHNFFRGMPRLYRCTNTNCRKVFFSPRDRCDSCSNIVESLAICRSCSKEFFVANVSYEELLKLVNLEDDESIISDGAGHMEFPQLRRFSALESMRGNAKLWYAIPEEEVRGNQRSRDGIRMKKCIKCGSFSSITNHTCSYENDGTICSSKDFVEVLTFPHDTTTGEISTRPHDCPFCGSSYGSGYVITEFDMTPKQASVNLFNMIFDHIPNHKLLIFCDNRQDAASLAGWMDFAHDDTAIKQMIMKKLQLLCKDRRYVSYRELIDDELVPEIIGKWYNYRPEDYDRTDEDILRNILIEFTSPTNLSLERLGLIEFNYQGLSNVTEFSELLEKQRSIIKINRSIPENILRIIQTRTEEEKDFLRKFMITILNLMRREGAMFGLHQKHFSERSDAVGFIFDLNNVKTRKKHGAVVKVINNPIQKFVKYTKKVFQIEDDDEAVIILEFLWNFLINEGFLRETGIVKGSTRFNEPLHGHVLTTNKIRLGLPTQIDHCSRCHKIYTNIPHNMCATIARSKICNGVIESVSFEEFYQEADSHFLKMFSEGEPVRMITKEDTGALSNVERKRIQNDFGGSGQQERKVDVVVATPTLELGVDIGDLSSIGMYKSPPSPVSYLQRVGRAGRKDGIAFINTFLFESPIDEFHYRNPQDLIKGKVNPPFINFEYDKIKNHINAIILEEVFLSGDKEVAYPSKVADFVADKKGYLIRLAKDIEKHKNAIEENIRGVLNDIEEYKNTIKVNDAFVNNLLEKTFIDSIDEALTRYEEEVASCRKGISEYSRPDSDNTYYQQIKLKDLVDLQEELKEKDLLFYFLESNVLPRYAFPGTLVQIEDLGGIKFEGRSRNIAISEFAPGCEITLRKRVYKSVGVDVVNKAPESFWVCKNCSKYFSKENWKSSGCKICGSTDSPMSIRSISPTKIFLKQKSQSVTDYVRYGEPNVEAYLPSNAIIDSKEIELPSFSIKIVKHGYMRMLMGVGEVFTEGISDDEEDDLVRSSSKIEICNQCGKVKERRDERLHKSLGQKFGKESCRGIFAPLTLHHEMPTNVISIKVTRIGEPEPSTYMHRKFLTTLKNAIIFAGQTIAEAEESEIEGQIKNDEIILYDNVEGGTGYVNIIFERFIDVLQRASQNISSEFVTYGESCENGCLRCLWSYRRKRDIRYIDKNLIIPLLDEIMLTKDEYDNKEFQNTDKIKPIVNTVSSKSFSLKGPNKIKEVLRSAQSTIIIYTPKISDQIIDWESENPKSWIDILGAIQNSGKNVKLTVFTLEPETYTDQSNILNLASFGIDVFEIKKQDFEDGENIIENSIIVVDPLIPANRTSIQFTSTFTEQAWKEFVTIKISKDEQILKINSKKIEKIREKSFKDNEINKFGKFKVIAFCQDNPENLKKAVQEFANLLSEAQYEVKILDAYLGRKNKYENIHWYLHRITSWIPNNVSVSVVTSVQNHTDVNNLSISLTASGHKTDIVTYDEMIPKPIPIHDRFIIIDEKYVIDLGKGLRFLYDYERFGQIGSFTDIKISKDLSIVKMTEDIFDKYWNYQSNIDPSITNWPKFDTRK